MRIRGSIIGLLACLWAASALAPPATATVVVYTDPVAWEGAVGARVRGHLHEQPLEEFPASGLSSGINQFGPMLSIDIPGTPGSNAIDDSPTSALSPNGSTYYLGDVGIGASIPPVLAFIDYPPMFQVIGFGADWVVDGDLFMEVQGTLISIGDFLPTGSGFLGVLSDQHEPQMFVHLSGAALFGMDQIRTGNVPEPATLCLLASAGIGAWRAALRRARHAAPSH